jgi:hypothetical protein
MDAGVLTSTRRRRLAASAAAAVAFALVAAGCSTESNSQQPEGQPLPGITATTVNVGFNIVDLGELSAALGFVQPDYGGVAGVTRQIQAVVDHVNANGGMGGRQVVPNIKGYVGGTDSPAQAQAQCSAFTQDGNAFGVIAEGLFQTNAIPCYAAARTLVFDVSLIARDQTSFEQSAPYLWSPINPEYGSFLQAQLQQMQTAGFFTGATGVLLMPADDEVSRRVTESIAKPFLAQAGVTQVQTSYVDSTNTASLGESVATALAAGKSRRLNRVVTVGGARIEAVALSDAEAVGYESVWGMSTYDNPFFIENNTEFIIGELRNGMAGLGYSPFLDIGNASLTPTFPDPSNPGEQLCFDIVNAAGATPPENLRPNWRLAMMYCDGIMFMKAALDRLPGTDTVTGEDFTEAVAGIGDAYRPASVFSASWGPGVYAGTNSGRALSWNATCACFEYGTTDVPFGPSVAIPATSPTAAPPPASTAPPAPAASPPASPPASAPASPAPVPAPTS